MPQVTGKMLEALASLSPAVLAHSVRVASAGETDDERLLGLLHDMREEGVEEVLLLPCNVEAALAAITREPREVYADYIARVAENPLARRVKVNDLRDNLFRMDGSYTTLRPRYERALNVLLKED